MNIPFNEVDQKKIKNKLGVEDINDFYFEDIMGGIPTQ